MIFSRPAAAHRAIYTVFGFFQSRIAGDPCSAIDDQWPLSGTLLRPTTKIRVYGGLVEADGVTLPLSWTFQEGLDNNSDLF